MENFWDFSVWGTFSVFAVLLGSLLLGNALQKSIPFLRNSLTPTSVISGIILIVIAAIYKAFTGQVIFDTPFFGGNGTKLLEIITYHSLALGFIATTLKGSERKLTKQRSVEIFNTGITTVGTYLIQGIVGFAITLIIVRILPDLFPPAGLLLPFGYGQGTGQALNYGTIFETEFGFEGGKSFGLTIAALGFLSASIGGVLYLNVIKRHSKLTSAAASFDPQPSSERLEESPDEIAMTDSLDKMTVQISLIAVAYFLTYGLMYLLGMLVPGMKSVIYGFNFLIGVISAILIKGLLKLLKKRSIVKKQYTNDFLLTRCGNFCFDIMIVSGIAAIRLDILERYWGVIIILGVAGTVVTYLYTRISAKILFPDYAEEQFLMMYGMLTGTASTGIILLREIDGDFRTPASSNMVYQNLPAIVFGFPLMILVSWSPTTAPNYFIPMIVFCLYFVAINLILFRRQIFCRRKAKTQKQ